PPAARRGDAGCRREQSVTLAPASAERGRTGSAFATRIAHAVERLSITVTQLRGWRRAGVAFLAGAVSAAAMAPFFLSPVLFVTLPVLVWLIDGGADAGPSRRALFLRAAGIGWWFGFGYFLLGLFW